MTQSTRAGQLVFALCFLGFAALMLSQISSQTIWASGKQLTSQPRFWPCVGLVMMVAFGALHALSEWRQPHRGTLVELMHWVLALEFVAWLMGYVFLVPQLGYLPATLVVSLGLGLRIGMRSARGIAICLGTGFVVVVLFRVVLRVNIPGGRLYHALPDPISTFLLTYF